ncbi:MAG: chromosomal replication initiator protein DnaA [Porphyromonadaceae bacterium]|nr:chromosomal replication initiator protein DnaA [Porphyromonadaceae bacterium]
MIEKSMCSVIDLWNECLSIIKNRISESVFVTWFKPIIPLNYDKKEIILQVPTMFFYEYIEEKYSDLIRAALNTVTGEDTVLLYRVLMDRDINTPHSDVPAISHKPQLPARQQKVFSPFENTVNVNFDSQLNETYTFDSFVEGNSNKLVRSAGLNIAQNPGKTVFNPLFIFGNSGVGKTHISNAIGIETKKQNPHKRILYVSANLFQIQYTDAVRTNNQNDFLNFYQSLDMLIIDDIHEFMSKPGTQNTFFNIFNHLHRLGKQIILTCDRQPSELKGMEERLLTRFRWGLTAEITKPDIELRNNILRYKIKNNNLLISEDVISFIADNVTENIRDLEGVLISLLAHSTINNEEISVELAKKIINLTPKEKKKINIEYICDLVCEHYSVSQDDLCSKSRKAIVAQPRQVAMYLARKHTSYSLDTIANTIGNRTHATVIHSCKLIESLIKQDKLLRNDIQMLEARIK